MQPLEFLSVRERFLPVQQASLLERMRRDPRLSEEERGRLQVLFEMIAARFHFEFRRDLERLKALYDPFDPDREMLPLSAPGPEELEARRAELREAFGQLLQEGNYVELPRERIVECLELQGHGGLLVKANLDDYRELAVFYRGVHEEERPVSRWPLPWPASPFGLRMHKEPVLSRVAVLVRPAGSDEHRVFIKLFKNVAVSDLKMILPRVRIHMRWFDQVKIGSTVAGSLGTAAWKAITAAFLSPAVFLIVMAGFIGALLKGVFSFVASRTRYMQTLSSRLYFQNLANNTSALAFLVDAAEAEEAKELLLAYFLLYVERECDYTQEELDRRVEAWLGEQFGLAVDFEVADAVRKLVDKGLVVTRECAGPAGPRRLLKVYDLPTSLRRLDKVWDEYFAWNGHRAETDDRLADATWPPPHHTGRHHGQGVAAPQRL